MKVCELCGISYILDYRTKNHQKHCPYGCVEINRKSNKQKAKNRYRKTRKAAFKASEYNGRYRERKRNGQVLAEIPEINYQIENVEKKLTGQIKFFYKKLNPDISCCQLKRLDKILHKISHRITAT